MAITNLTNTKWTFNETVDLDFSSTTWNISFTTAPYEYAGSSYSNNKELTAGICYQPGTTDVELFRAITYSYDLGEYTQGNQVYASNNEPLWTSEDFKTIEITGGDDVENADLIAFLEANATYIEEENSGLLNTTGVLSDNPSYPNGYNETPYQIDFTDANGHVYSALGFSHGDSVVVNYYDEEGQKNVFYKTGADGCDTITITGGADLNNPNLIAGLEENQRSSEPEQPEAPEQPEESVDLTNTKWLFNDSLTLSSTTTYNVLFRTAEQLSIIDLEGSGEELLTYEYNTFRSIALFVDGATQTLAFYTKEKAQGDYVIVYNSISGWVEPDAKTIELAGGNDITSVELSEFLNNNATKVEIEYEEVLDLDLFLASVADAIRFKKGTTESINAQNFVKEIRDLKVDGGSNTFQLFMETRGEDGTLSGDNLFNNYQGSDLTEILNSLDFSLCKSLYGLFFNCYNLLSIPLFNLGNATDIHEMFSTCANLTTIPQLDTSKVIDMSFMFVHCGALTTVPQLDTSKVTTMKGMFGQCKSLTTIPQLDTSNVTDMHGMFAGCENLTTIPPLDTSKVTDMGNMFNQCKNLLQVLQLDTSNVTNIYSIFLDCENLTSIPALDTSNVTDMNSMFCRCKNLKVVDITNLSKKVQDWNEDGIIDAEEWTINHMLSGCHSLTTLVIRNLPEIPSFSDYFASYFTMNQWGGDDSRGYHFTGTVDETYNPEGLRDGKIYVPDDKVEEIKTTGGWSEIADLIYPLSAYTPAEN